MIDTPYTIPEVKTSRPHHRAVLILLIITLLAVVPFLIMYVHYLWAPESSTEEIIPIVQPPAEGTPSPFPIDVQEASREVRERVTRGELTREEGERLTNEILKNAVSN